MSKHKTKPEDIRDPERYFNSFVATEVRRSTESTQEYYKMFDSLDQIIEDVLDGHRGQYTRALAAEDPCVSLEDLQRCESPSEWMELMRSEALFKAFRRLSEEHQSILFLRYYKQQTQKEIADSMGVSQQAVGKEEKKAIKILWEVLSSGC